MITEKFDIDRFSENSLTQTSVFDEIKGIWQDTLVHTGYCEETLSDGTIRIQTEKNYTDGGKAYTESIVPPNNVFCIYKVFSSDGSLKMKFTKDHVLGTVSFIPTGKEFYYDKKGMLIKEIDNERLNEEVKVTPDALFPLLSKHNIYDPAERPSGVLYVWFNSSTSKRNEDAKIPYQNGDNPFWEITRICMDKETGSFETTYKIDAITEKLTEIN